jgi:hypothetical protein
MSQTSPNHDPDGRATASAPSVVAEHRHAQPQQLANAGVHWPHRELRHIAEAHGHVLRRRKRLDRRELTVTDDERVGEGSSGVDVDREFHGAPRQARQAGGMVGLEAVRSSGRRGTRGSGRGDRGARTMRQCAGVHVGGDGRVRAPVAVVQRADETRAELAFTRSQLRRVLWLQIVDGSLTEFNPSSTVGATIASKRCVPQGEGLGVEIKPASRMPVRSIAAAAPQTARRMPAGAAAPAIHTGVVVASQRSVATKCSRLLGSRGASASTPSAGTDVGDARRRAPRSLQCSARIGLER